MGEGGRVGKVQRITRETSIDAVLRLDGSGEAQVATGIGLLDHMLTALARHGLMDLTLSASGDLHVDTHHTVEDVGIVLGKALAEALGDRAGIRRYGDATVPMDEALVLVSVDLSGRPFVCVDLALGAGRLGDFELETAPEFFRAFATAAGMNLHIRRLCGQNAHHVLEASFKALARALDSATRIDGRQKGIPSTKGVL